MINTICITGADRGLGFALVKRYLQAEFIVFAGKYLKKWHELEKLQAAYPATLHLVAMDITADRSVKKAAAFIAGKGAHLDILINNAGIIGNTDATLFEKPDFSGITREFNVNALGALRVSHYLAPLLVKGNAKLIVNISSEAGSIADCERKGWFGYCMSKAALNMESCIIHNNLKEVGGQVLIVHPGWMKTYMHGYKNEQATYTSEESADRIFTIVAGHTQYRAEKPVFIDVLGKVHNW